MKKAFSVLIALIMVLSVFSVCGFAAGTTVKSADGNVTVTSSGHKLTVICKNADVSSKALYGGGYWSVDIVNYNSDKPFEMTLYQVSAYIPFEAKKETPISDAEAYFMKGGFGSAVKEVDCKINFSVKGSTMKWVIDLGKDSVNISDNAVVFASYSGREGSISAFPFTVGQYYYTKCLHQGLAAEMKAML